MTTKHPLRRESMLPDFLIERLRRWERPVAQEQPRLELPLPYPPPATQVQRKDDDERDRGVCIIDLGA